MNVHFACESSQLSYFGPHYFNTMAECKLSLKVFTQSCMITICKACFNILLKQALSVNKFSFGRHKYVGVGVHIYLKDNEL